MSVQDWQRIAGRLNAHLAEVRWSSQDVARRAGVDRKTVDRLRAGHAVRAQTLQWIEQALGLSLETRAPTPDHEAAPVEYGGYRKDAVLPYAGEYTGYRRSFDSSNHIVASHLRMYWEDTLHALRFQEHQRNRTDTGRAFEYDFQGDVLIPPNLGVMHLVVRSDDGRVRLVTTSMPREDQGSLVMRGFLLTLNEIRDIGYYPVASPVVFAKRSGNSGQKTGVICPEDEQFAWAKQSLDDVEGRFLPPCPG